MSTRSRNRAGGWIVVLALVTCLGFTAALAWQAYDAVRRHRESAEQVVREYASTAAAEFLGRSRTQLDYYGLVPAIRAVLDWNDANPTGPLPSIAELREGANERQKQGLTLATGVFRIRTGMIETGDGVTHDGNHAVQSGMIALLKKEPLEARQLKVMKFDDGIRLAATQDGRGGVVGFQIDSRVAGEFFAFAHAGTPLVPSLSEGGLENEEIFVRISDSNGEVLFESAGSWNPETGVEHAITDDFGEFLSGMFLQTSITPDAARRIVAGGIPASRLPLLLAMLAITALLLIMALLQIRRERQLALLRSDFVSGVSHELRTPLTQIRMFSETLLLGRTRSDDERQRALAIIDQEARRLTHLVENILQFSRAERGAIRIATSRTDLSELVEETVDGFRPLAASRGSTITVSIDDRPMADVDGDALRQVLLNLLDNALKYGPSGQTITVGLTSIGPVARITVDDQGPGVPKERREQIWNRFFRLEANRNSAVGGSGIGLSVVHELVTQHGGTVSVEDAQEGTGSRFAVQIPCIDPRVTQSTEKPEPVEAS